MTDATFTTQEAMAVRERLRDELGLGEESLSVQDLARMIGDEAARMGDMARVALIVKDVTGKGVDPAVIAAATTEEAHRSGEEE